MNKYRFKELYAAVITRWPNSIEVKEKVFFDNGGVRIPNLISVHDKISYAMEDDFPEDAEENDEYADWCGFIDWSVFTMLHRLAKENDVVYPHALDEEDVLNLCLEYEDAQETWVA